jgi:hypothetical protein
MYDAEFVAALERAQNEKGSDGGIDEIEYDELYEQARDLVMESRQASSPGCRDVSGWLQPCCTHDRAHGTRRACAPLLKQEAQRGWRRRAQGIAEAEVRRDSRIATRSCGLAYSISRI